MAEPVHAIDIQVCYARPGKQFVRALTVPDGTAIQQAIESSGVLTENPEIDLAVSKTGIFGKLKLCDTVLRNGDRVEIYRPLIADPKESRRQRAEKKDARKVG